MSETLSAGEQQTTAGATPRDRRTRPPYPQEYRKGDENDLVTREEAGRLAGVDPRTITRWAKLEYLTKFANARGSVRFSRRQVLAMSRFEPE